MPPRARLRIVARPVRPLLSTMAEGKSSFTFPMLTWPVFIVLWMAAIATRGADVRTRGQEYRGLRPRHDSASGQSEKSVTRATRNLREAESLRAGTQHLPCGTVPRHNQKSRDAMITESDISLALPADAVAIAALSRRAIEQGLEWRWTPQRVMNSMAHADTNVVVARRGADLLGFAIMSYGDEEAHVQLLATQPRCRRQGVGSALLTWLELTARVAGIGTLRLESRSDNAGARAFYRHHGFEEVDRRTGYYQGIEDAVRLAKTLASPEA